MLWQKLERRIIRENNIFIIPSYRGFLFLGLAMVMILVAATYNNNLIFILGAFLFSTFVVVLLQTHYNLKGVRLRFVTMEEGFEGTEVHMAFELSQKRSRLKSGLEIRSRSKEWKNVSSEKHMLRSTESTKPVRVTVVAPRRGEHSIPQIVLETYYPLGLFRAWKVYRPEGQVMIYPKPAGEVPLAPSPSTVGVRDEGTKPASEGDMGELRAYRAGDSFHQVAWKHFARTGDMHSRANWGGEDRHYSIPWLVPQTPGDTETNLRQMSAWIDVAVREDARFEMSTPQGHIGAGQGMEHARKCWRVLAKVASPE